MALLSKGALGYSRIDGRDISLRSGGFRDDVSGRCVTCIPSECTNYNECMKALTSGKPWDKHPKDCGLAHPYPVEGTLAEALDWVTEHRDKV